MDLHAGMKRKLSQISKTKPKADHEVNAELDNNADDSSRLFFHSAESPREPASGRPPGSAPYLKSALKGGKGGEKGEKDPRGKGKGKAVGFADEDRGGDGGEAEHRTGGREVRLPTVAEVPGGDSAEPGGGAEGEDQGGGGEGGGGGGGAGEQGGGGAGGEAGGGMGREEEEEEQVGLDLDLTRVPAMSPAAMQELLDRFTPEQMNRYEAYRRSGFKQASMRRLVHGVAGATVSPQLGIVMAGVAKLMVGELVETARLVMGERGDEGPIRPTHIREAHRRLRMEKRVPVRSRPPLFR
ncbi:hypothetical protein CLOM_g21330 [Closterium sp. NIES-68]|nr:hypothetical protein CLOM_g21330 [Closterium sp. NIES-68]GJP71930.1 hypothetical protein CLOP_g2716 [Closterium sp. NIES-67]